MKKSLLLIFLTACLQIFAQLTYVPDDNFEQMLIGLNYDDVLDDYVLTENINTVTFLGLDYQNIEDLSGIEDFVALTSLYCNYNQLISLDLSQNTSLVFLTCDHNQLNSINVSQNLALKWFSCQTNQLTSLDVLQNIALIELRCHSNQLTSLDLSQNMALDDLDCSFNQILSLDISQNTAITELACYSNQLTSLDVSQNTALTELTCNSNQLISLDVSQNTALNSLVCYDSQLTSLDVSQNTALTILYCFDNQLSSLNIKNGNNINMLRMRAIENPDLTCIQVDDENATYPECNLQYPYNGWCKDEWAEYSENCPPIGIEESLTNKGIKIYPNPTQGFLNIEATGIIDKDYTIYNIYGAASKQGVLNDEQIDISTLNSGIYLLKIGGLMTKIVKF